MIGTAIATHRRARGTSIDRVDALDGPPVVGRYYLVRAIFTDRGGHRERPLWWPIIGTEHTDVEFFNFVRPHYHIDVRFLTAAHLRRASWIADNARADFLARPLQRWHAERGGSFRPLPPPEIRRMRCAVAAVDYPYAGMKAVVALNKSLSGQRAISSKRGWVCPHRKVALATVAPDANGIITCPLHGLRIHAKTGLCAGAA